MHGGPALPGGMKGAGMDQLAYDGVARLGIC
jgi:hypothetical protein